MPIQMKTTIELKAPNGKFRVIGVDTFDNTDWISGDYDTYLQAVDIAKTIGGKMLKSHVYDDQGKHVFETGTF